MLSVHSSRAFASTTRVRSAPLCLSSIASEARYGLHRHLIRVHEFFHLVRELLNLCLVLSSIFILLADNGGQAGERHFQLGVVLGKFLFFLRQLAGLNGRLFYLGSRSVKVLHRRVCEKAIFNSRTGNSWNHCYLLSRWLLLVLLLLHLLLDHIWSLATQRFRSNINGDRLLAFNF